MERQRSDISYVFVIALYLVSCLFSDIKMYVILFIVRFQVWRINGSAKTPVPTEDIGKFYSGDCYIVLYTYHSHERKEDYYLCYWIGKDSIEVFYIDYVKIYICSYQN